MAELATEKQLNMMSRLGIRILPDMTKGEAFKAIQAYMDSKKPKDITSTYSQEVTSPPLDKDTLIVRQSCLKAAVEHINNFKPELLKTKEADSEVLALAEEFEKWVFR